VTVPILQAPERRWWCPNCDLLDVTREARPHTQMHSCRGMYGLTTPMVPVGERAKSVSHEREDYVGMEMVTYADVDGRRRPIMNVVTTRDDGEDCTVYAPCAYAEMRP